jgi:hypothetical protein
MRLVVRSRRKLTLHPSRVRWPPTESLPGRRSTVSFAYRQHTPIKPVYIQKRTRLLPLSTGRAIHSTSNDSTSSPLHQLKHILRAVPSRMEALRDALSSLALVPTVPSPKRAHLHYVLLPLHVYGVWQTANIGRRTRASVENWRMGRPRNSSVTLWLSLPEIKFGRIDDANLRGAGRPRCGQQPEQHALPVHPCSAIGACERHCNIFGRIPAGGEGAARRTPRHDQGSPVGSSR